jgi:hypothetical protein
MPKLDAGHRRALKLLADAADGWSEALLLAYGLSAGLIADLVDTKLGTTETKRVLAAGRPVEVVRIRITDAGRKRIEHG